DSQIGRHTDVRHTEANAEHHQSHCSFDSLLTNLRFHFRAILLSAFWAGKRRLRNCTERTQPQMIGVRRLVVGTTNIEPKPARGVEPTIQSNASVSLSI